MIGYLIDKMKTTEARYLIGTIAAMVGGLLLQSAVAEMHRSVEEAEDRLNALRQAYDTEHAAIPQRSPQRFCSACGYSIVDDDRAHDNCRPAVAAEIPDVETLERMREGLKAA